MGDFLTIRQLNLPIKVVIFNNGSLAFVELEMIAAGLLDHGSQLELCSGCGSSGHQRRPD
jgi:pyruvate dehydrogenase (quinone)